MRREDVSAAAARSRASAKVSLSSMTSWRIFSRPTNAACPSFRWRIVGLQSEAGERAQSSEAQHDLLADARLLVSAVELRGDLAVLGGIVGDVGIEQEEGNPADAHEPHQHLDHPVPHRQSDRRGRPSGACAIETGSRSKSSGG